MHSEQITKKIWVERREELNSHVRKNIYGFFTTNALFGVLMWGTSSFVWRNGTFIKGFIVFLAVYFLFAYTIHKLDQKKDRALIKRRYILLMFWHSLFFLVLASSCFVLFITVLDLLQVLNIPYGKLSLILILILFISIWWTNRDIKQRYYSEGERNRFELLSMASGITLIFVCLVVAVKFVSSIEMNDGTNLAVLAIFSSSLGISAFFRAISYIYKDLLVLKLL